MERVMQWIRKTMLAGGLVLAFGMGLWGTGCIQRAAPTEGEDISPPLDVRVSYSTGSPLSGPVPMDVNALRIDDSYGVTIHYFALESIPPQALEPLHKYIRLVMMAPRANFIAPVSRLTPGARVALTDVDVSLLESVVDGAWGRCVPVGRVQAILPPAITAKIEFESHVEASALGNRLRFLVARRRNPDPNDPNDPNTLPRADACGEHLEMALIRSGQVTPMVELQPSNLEASTPARAASNSVTERVVLLPVALKDMQHAALLIPFAWEVPWAHALGLFITVGRLSGQPPAPEQLETFAQCVDNLMRQEADLRSIHGESPTWAGCLLALDQLTWPAHWRRALVYLATTAQAPLTEDVALAAPMDLAQTLAGELYRAQAENPARDMAHLTWLLEKTAYRLLLDTAKQDDLSPALWYLLQRHAGQMSQQLPTLREQLAEARDLADLNARLRHENLISLEDMSPAARTRAYDWLQQRGFAPTGFDPLASAKQRRAVLDRMNDGTTP
jgi:hypothetical protein